MEEGEMREFALRPFQCELNYLSRSDGSAILSQGQTVVLASLNGPSESKRQKMFFEKPNFEVVYRNKGGMMSSEERIKAGIIKSACESTLFPTLYARCDITLSIHELQNRGSEVSAAVNAGCLALVNSGLEMQFLVASVTVMITKENEIILDPDNDQMENAVAVLTVAFNSTLGDIVALDLTSKQPLDSAVYSKLVEAASEGSKSIFNKYREIVNKYCKYL